MKIVWDEPKRRRNIAKHGLDFAALTVEFFEASIVVPGRDGRLVAVGELNDSVIVTVVFAILGTEAVSIISMRPASRRERNMQ